MMRWISWIAFLSLLGFVVITAVALWRGSDRILCPPRASVDAVHQAILDRPAEYGLKIQSLQLKLPDGLATPVLYCEPEPGAGERGRALRSQLEQMPAWGRTHATAVLLHPHKGRKEIFLPVAERFCAIGVRCVIPDLPGHGESAVPFTCYGAKEKQLPSQLVRAVAEQMKFEPGPCFLFGYSMGGSVALQAAGAEPERWAAVATMATFAVLDEAVGRSAAWEFGQQLSPYLHAMVRPVVSLRAGFDLREVSNPQAVSHAKLPSFLIVHGGQDLFVPPDHAQRIFAALPGEDKELMIVPEAKHGDVLSSAAPVYATVAKSWLKHCQF
jgi:uncharacterized protein